MPMTLYFKRAKAFVSQDDNAGTKKFLAQPGPHPQPVPFWIAATATFKQGIKDGSIVNLTPPDQMPGYKAPAVAEDPVELTAEELDAADNADGLEAQNEVPKAEFGGQPMTPVVPALKIGGITGNGKKKS